MVKGFLRSLHADVDQAFPVVAAGLDDALVDILCMDVISALTLVSFFFAISAACGLRALWPEAAKRSAWARGHRFGKRGPAGR